MDRRKFLGRVITAMAGTTVGISGVRAGFPMVDSSAREGRTVAYGVKGFSCETCATGLEVMLRRQKGVVRASASYADARVVIGFDENLTSEDTLKEFISSCGFTVA
jgi:hypothetical protein